MSSPCPAPLLQTQSIQPPTHNYTTTGASDPIVYTNSSTAVYHRYKLAVEVYVVGLLCLFGISGNVVSAVVLGRDRSIRRTTGFLLQMLAMSDTVYLITCLFYQTLNTINDLTDWLPAPVSRGYKSWVNPFTWPCASIAQTCTVWLVVVVTADRYVAICKPLHSPQYSTVSRVRCTVIIIWILAIIYNLPRFFERTVVEIPAIIIADNVTGGATSSLAVGVAVSTAPSASGTISLTGGRQPSPLGGALVGQGGGERNNVTSTTCFLVQKSAFRNNPVYILVYKTCLFFLVRFLAPFTALAFFNTRLIHAIRASNSIQSKSSPSSQDRRYRRASGSTTTRSPGGGAGGSGGGGGGAGGGGSTRRGEGCARGSRRGGGGGGVACKNERYTLTLVVVVIVFVFCELPDLLLRLWLALFTYFSDTIPFPRDSLQYVNGISNLLLTVNSCVNFLIYCVMGRRFRVILVQTLTCHGKAWHRAHDRGSRVGRLGGGRGVGVAVDGRVGGAGVSLLGMRGRGYGGEGEGGNRGSFLRSRLSAGGEDVTVHQSEKTAS